MIGSQDQGTVAFISALTGIHASSQIQCSITMPRPSWWCGDDSYHLGLLYARIYYVLIYNHYHLILTKPLLG